MHAFKDVNGKSWSLEITVASLRRVKALLGLDLLGLVKGGFAPLGELVGDPLRLADVLWCLVEPQAVSAKVTDEDFGRALAGDAIALAAEAFVEELVDFFPDARARRNLRQALAAGREVAAILLERTATELAQIDPAALAQTWIASSGSSPASSAATPAPSPSPSS